MTKEYYQAKADLCRDLAIKQMVNGEAKEAGANLIRMVNALNEINLINYKEKKVGDKCVTCEQDKDTFSKENEYEQCETCANEDYYKEEKASETHQFL